MTTETAGKIVGSSKTFPIDNIIFFRSTFDRNPRPYPNVLEANQRRPPSGRSGANHRPTPMNRRRNELHPVTPSRFFLLATLRIEGITPIHLHPTRVKNASTRHQASNGTFKKEPSGVPEGRKPIAILFFSWGGGESKTGKTSTRPPWGIEGHGIFTETPSSLGPAGRCQCETLLVDGSHDAAAVRKLPLKQR